RKERQIAAHNYSGAGDGLGEAASSVGLAVAWLRNAGTLIFCTSSILRCLSARRSLIRCSRSVVACEGSAMRPLSSGGTVREAQRELFEELEQFWVSRPISLVAPMLSLFRPTLSPGRPTLFSVERVVVRQLNLVFGTSKPAQ